MNSGLSVITGCIPWWPGLKSGFFLLALGAAIRSPALTRPTPNLSSLSSGLFCSFLPQFPYWRSPELLPASCESSGSCSGASKVEEIDSLAFWRAGCSLLRNLIRLAYCPCSPRWHQECRSIILNEPSLIK